MKEKKLPQSVSIVPRSDTWSAKKFFNMKVLNTPTTAVVEEEEDLLNLNVIPATNSFCNVLNYHMYLVVNKSNHYNGKLAARRGEYVTSMMNVMKPFMFVDRNVITVLRILYRFRRSGDYMEVLVRAALWILLSILEEGPCACFKNLMVFISVCLDACAQQKLGGDKIDTCDEAVNNLLTSYVINPNNARALSEISKLKKMPQEPAVQFAVAVILKTVRLGKANIDKGIRKVLIDGLPTITRTGARLCLGCELEATLAELAQ